MEVKKRLNKVDSKKKSLKKVLYLFWKNNSFFEKPRVEKSFIDDLKNDMDKSSKSFKSMMDIHVLLVDTYKKLIKKQKELN